jgi:hypothetical protein
MMKYLLTTISGCHIFILALLLSLVQGMTGPLTAQRFQTLKQAEDSLVSVVGALNLADDDSVSMGLNRIFSACLLEALTLSGSDTYPFERLPSLAKITSPDNRFRIVHWNLPGKEGRHRYFGFVKMFGHEPPLIHSLKDVSDSVPDPDTLILDNLRWFGALYYRIIPGETAEGKKIYTLLGWAGKNTQVTQKVIEILHFDDRDRPVFGFPLFRDYHGGNLTRVIFRYTASATMSLKYENRMLQSEKKWNSRKRIFESSAEEREMIVFDRLVPLDPQLSGQYQFYVPAGDLTDGFVFSEKGWKFVEGTDSRNK